MSTRQSAKARNGEAWDEEETRLLQVHVDAGALNKKRRLEALDEINSYRKTRHCSERTWKSLNNKILRMQPSEQGPSVLPGPDTDKAISDLASSSKNVIAELRIIEKQHKLQKARERIWAMKSAYSTKRKAILERRVKEDAEAKQELEKISQAEVMCGQIGDMDQKELLEIF
ncbi:MAG: hypothetical protein J3Q66DRAFT_343154 [Benniella sp.]|nr:MAG: hypothetical protein J3Q66DRAFT_343154 [Benniella sp.]